MMKTLEIWHGDSGCGAGAALAGAAWLIDPVFGCVGTAAAFTLLSPSTAMAIPPSDWGTYAGAAFANTVAPLSEKLCSEVLNALLTLAALPVALTIRLLGSTVTPVSPWLWR